MHRPYALLAASKTVLLGLVYGHSNCLSSTSNVNQFSICCMSCKYAQVFWQVAAENKYVSPVDSHCFAFLCACNSFWTGGIQAFGEDAAITGKSLYCSAKLYLQLIEHEDDTLDSSLVQTNSYVILHLIFFKTFLITNKLNIWNKREIQIWLWF